MASSRAFGCASRAKIRASLKPNASYRFCLVHSVSVIRPAMGCFMQPLTRLAENGETQQNSGLNKSKIIWTQEECFAMISEAVDLYF